MEYIRNKNLKPGTYRRWCRLGSHYFITKERTRKVCEECKERITKKLGLNDELDE